MDERRYATAAERLSAPMASELLDRYYLRLVDSLASYARHRRFDYERSEWGTNDQPSSDDRHYDAAYLAIEDAYSEARSSDDESKLWHFLNQRARRYVKAANERQGKVRAAEWERWTYKAHHLRSEEDQQLATDLMGAHRRGDVDTLYFLLDALPKDAARAAVRAMNDKNRGVSSVTYAPSKRRAARKLRQRHIGLDETVHELRKHFDAEKWDAAFAAVQADEAAG